MNDVNEDMAVRQSLKSALPAVVPAAPSRDLWPDVVARVRRPARWSMLDTSLAAVVVLALLLFPKWFWFLAYHL
jgi:hypothetical protein